MFGMGNRKGSLPSDKTALPRLWGSTLAYVLGWLFLFAAVSALTRAESSWEGLYRSGVIVLMGAFAYRSKKKRIHGLIGNDTIRIGVELIMVVAITIQVLVLPDVKTQLVEDPFRNFVIPVWSVVPYFYIQDKGIHKKLGGNMDKVTALFACVCLLCLSAINVMPSFAGKPVLEGADADYMLEVLKTASEEDGFSPQEPKSEKQKILHSMMNELNGVEQKQVMLIGEIGPIEFDSFDDLKDISQIRDYRDHFNKYCDLRSQYYDEKASLLTKYNPMLGKEVPPGGRSPDSFTSIMENLEKSYCRDLGRFYTYAIAHHQELLFRDGGIQIESDSTLNEFNSIWDSVVKSSTEMVEARENFAKFMQKGIESIK